MQTNKEKNMTNIIKIEQEKKQIDHLRALARIAAESKQYASATEAQLFNLMLSAKDLGISPMKAINGGFYIVNGKVCMSTALMADRIRRYGHSIKIVEMSKDKCTIIAIRKDNNDSLKLEYTWEDATLAGLTGSLTWKKYPKNMLYNRCMSQVARILFPDVVGNSYSEEERFDIQNVPAENRPLENADTDLIVDTPVIEENLSSEQCEQLSELLLELDDDGKIEEFICKRASIEDVYDLPPQKFNGVVEYLEKQIANKKQKSEEVSHGSEVA